MDNNKISEIPIEVENLQRLRHFSADNNLLLELSPGLTNLPVLESLSMCGNRMVHISEDIQELTNLRSPFFINHSFFQLFITFIAF